MDTPKTAVSKRAARRSVTAVQYHAPPNYALDVELYPVAELRRRVGDADARGLERIDFHCLIYLTVGRYAHMVDFETHSMAPGSLLLLQPGQVHRFGDLAGCDGSLLVFRSELLPSRAGAGAQVDPQIGTGRAVDELAMLQLAEDQRTHLRLCAAARQAVTETFERMAVDARRPACRALNTLLRSQVQSLLLRLQLEADPSAAAVHVEPAVLQRYRRYRAAVERHFASWHGVAPYAKRLGCSEKSLTRAALRVTDRSAKAVLTERLVLEAKRKLAHTLLPVAAVGDQLGFAEATNFVKFFRRETGLTPGVFREGQRGHSSVK
jgi:AraC-like DNA-binding protein